MARLVIQDPFGKRTSVELKKNEETTIGRALEANIVLADQRASRLHAAVHREGQKYIVKDLRSANGLFVNGKRVMETALAHEDVILIGRCQITFEDTDSMATVAFQDTSLSHGTTFLKPADQVVNPLSGPLGSTSGRALPEDDINSLRKKAKILTLMYELGQTLKGLVSLDEIYKNVGKLLLEVCKADRVLIMLFEKDTDQLAPVHVAIGNEADTELTSNLSVSRTITEKVLKDRVSLLSLNAAVDPNLSHGRSVMLQQLHSVMCAPLVVKGESLGVMYLDQRKVGAFTPDDLDLLNAVAAQMAIALETVRALERLTREAQARSAYSRFLPAHVVEELLQSPDSLKLGGVNQIVTVLFADIRGFTPFSAVMEPEEVVAILNQYFSEMTEIIFNHGGTLDKYIGDGLMALFGAPYATANDPLNAVQAAVEMQQRMQSLKEYFRSINRLKLTIEIGIGIYTGKVTVGYIGSNRRTDYTAIGDTVNMAARFESNAPRNGIYISDTTYHLVKDHFNFNLLDLKVKGKDEPVKCYQVMWQEEPEREHITDRGLGSH
ncbi:MAG TPA: adenylate/guanylate cyclase domain-containing protein [Blastocatellia bacterium]|nr:adenylate/guanylate cyclase domain-containing protein [Blastocatellia bacterium]